MFVNRVPSLKIKMFILEPWVDLKYSPTLVTSSRTRTRRNPEILKTFEGEKFCSRLMTSGKKSGKKSTSQVSVKSTSDETSKMSSELTKKKTLRTGHRNSAERKLECANFGRWPVECFKTTSDSNLLQVLPKGKAERYSGTGKRDSRFINGGRNCPSAKLKKLINSVVT